MVQEFGKILPDLLAALKEEEGLLEQLPARLSEKEVAEVVRRAAAEKEKRRQKERMRENENKRERE